LINSENNLKISEINNNEYPNNTEIQGEITKEKLDIIYNKVNDYCCSNLLFKHLKEAESIIKPEIKIKELTCTDDFRWFILYKDVKEEIQKLQNMEISGGFTVLNIQMNDKRNKIKEFNWTQNK